MVQQNRVVITGFGCLTSLGENLEQTWQALHAGQTGVDTISQWDTSDWEFKLGAEIKNYDPKKLISDRKLLKVLSKHDVIGLNAAQQAVDHSQLLAYRETLSEENKIKFNDLTGVYIGSPGIRFQQQYDFHPLLTFAQDDMKRFGEGIFDHIHPMWLLKILPNNVLAYVGINNQFKGANENVTNHAVSGMQALAEAFYAIKEGIVERACVVGYESAVEPESQIYYGNLGALSRHGIKSFDVKHDGTVLGEGAGSFIIESLASAERRKAKIYGEIISAATSNEALGIFSVQSEGEGITRVIDEVLTKANLEPDQIGMINAHANGTSNSDISEAKALHHYFSQYKTPITGYKWGIGHTLTAAGVIESIITLQALRQREMPGIATLQRLMPECAELNISSDKQVPKSDLGLIIARGFASINSAIILRAYS